MSARDLYSELNLQKSASVEEIKEAYRVLAKRYHPDLNPDDPGASQRFQELTNAYEVLQDVSKKRKYDVDIMNFDAPSPIDAHSASVELQSAEIRMTPHVEEVDPNCKARAMNPNMDYFARQTRYKEQIERRNQAVVVSTELRRMRRILHVQPATTIGPHLFLLGLAVPAAAWMYMSIPKKRA